MKLVTSYSPEHLYERFIAGSRNAYELLQGKPPPDGMYPHHLGAEWEPAATPQAGLIAAQASCSGLVNTLGLSSFIQEACYTGKPLDLPDVESLFLKGQRPKSEPLLSALLSLIPPENVHRIATVTEKLNQAISEALEQEARPVPGTTGRSDTTTPSPITIQTYYRENEKVGRYMWNSNNQPDPWMMPKSLSGKDLDVETCTFSTPTSPKICTWKKADLDLELMPSNSFSLSYERDSGVVGADYLG
jgi:hypothetical protein